MRKVSDVPEELVVGAGVEVDADGDVLLPPHAIAVKPNAIPARAHAILFMIERSTVAVKDSNGSTATPCQAMVAAPAATKSA
jgi:hypothetical protein